MSAKSLELLYASKKILELMASNRPLEEILHSLVRMIEAFSPGAQAAVYFIVDGKLRLGAAPSMPEEFLKVVDGCPIGDNHGVCGTASFTGLRTISTNVAKDEVWGAFTDWVLSFGIKSAWSNPVLGRDKKVIATVSLYYRDYHEPGVLDFEMVEAAAKLMEIAVDRKNQEELIDEQRIKLVTSSKLAALGEMAANLAHEINNPLAIIQNYATYIQLSHRRSRLTLDEASKIAEEVEKTVNRISGIMKGLKAISRDGDNDPFQKASLKCLIEETLSFCRERFHQHGVLLQVNQLNPSLNINCRPIQLSQALLNLLNNAFDAIISLPEKWIRIETKEDEDFCIISIIDSGTGIPDSLRTKIMEPFYTTKGAAQGTGLGLSITKKIIESHYGSFKIDEESSNTCFEIKLPVKEAV